MTSIASTLVHWPKTEPGDPILASTEDAIFYATLIYDNPPFVNVIKQCRRKILAQIGLARREESPNIHALLVSAFKNQFFRECLEEVDRLKNMTYQLKQGA